MSNTRVLLADAPTPWHETLLDALGGDAATVQVTSDGGVLREGLEQAKWKVVIIGDGLTGTSGLDVLFMTSKARAAGSQTDPRTRSIILLVLDARMDTELLALLRARGVDGFLRRSEPIEDVVARVRSCLYVDQRVAAREPLKAKAKVEIDGKQLQGTLEDLSTGGALLVLPAKKLSPMPGIGVPISFEATVEEVPLHVMCVLRRLDLRKALLGDRVALGVSFQAPDFDQRKAIETAIERVRASREPLQPFSDGVDASSKWVL